MSKYYSSITNLKHMIVRVSKNNNENNMRYHNRAEFTAQLWDEAQLSFKALNQALSTSFYS